MRRGLILGKFMPPHTGHQHLIDFARSYADRVTVLVCSLADDPIPGALRHRWVQELHPDCRVVHVTDVVPQAPEEDPAFWPIWRELIHRHEPRGVDLVFTSEAYGWRLASELGAAHVPVDPARRVNPISAEAIRADPFGNWRFLPPPVRPYYVKRVCLFGPESSGKSTIARLLAERLDTVHAPEFARDYLDPRGGACGIEDMATIARGQAAAAASAARHATKLLVLDTDPWLTTV
ncbi:MAG: AAA family ATPase, partial [Alphaproteobacteria bacterium]|nr:AAA family ATPase [Alphaproteobacteria bacterium]